MYMAPVLLGTNHQDYSNIKTLYAKLNVAILELYRNMCK